MVKWITGKSHVLLLVAVLLPQAIGCSASGDQSSNKPIYAADWLVEDYDRLEIQVNGMPALVKSNFAAQPWGRSGFAALNWFLCDGENIVTVVVSQPNAQKSSCQVRFTERPKGVDYDKSRQLVAFAPESGQETATFTTAITAAIPHKRSWQSAPPVSPLEERDRQAMLNYLQGMHAAWKSRDVERTMQLLSIPSEELAEAMYLDLDEYAQGSRSMLKQAFALSHAELSPLNLDEIRLTPYGPLVIAERDGFLLRLAAPEPGGSGQMQLDGCSIERIMFLKVDGQWQAVVVQ